MNSKLRTALEDLRSAVEWCIDPQRLSGVYVDRDKADKAVAEAEKAIRQAVGDEMLELVDGLEVDMEATEKHIRKAMAGESEDDIAERLLSASIDADDRKDTLDDVRQKIKQWQGGEDA